MTSGFSGRPSAIPAARGCLLALSLAAGGLAADPACPEFADPHAIVVEARPGDDLAEVVEKAASGTTILLAPGTYKVPEMIQFTRADVTLRSRTGKREDAILDGNNGSGALDPSRFTPEILAVRASNVALADITVRHARDHAVHVHPPEGASITGFLMHNVRIHDTGQQLVKVNSNGGTQPGWADSGTVRCSLLEFVDNSVMEPWDAGGFYTGGIDVHGGRDWRVAHNVFRNIQRDGELMEHAVHFWTKSRGTVVENNRFENVYRAIGFGMKTSASGPTRKYPDGEGDSPYLDHIGGVIRNNVIWNAEGVRLESGIELINAKGVEVYHNTVYSVDPPFSGIEYRFPNTSVIVKNNLLGHRLMRRDNASAEAAGNYENAPASAFVDAAKGDLRLALAGLPSLFDKAVKLEAGKAGLDMAGRERDAAPDIGAYERGALNSIRPGRARTGMRAGIEWFLPSDPGPAQRRHASILWAVPGTVRTHDASGRSHALPSGPDRAVDSESAGFRR
jgi:hypothetical protein